MNRTFALMMSTFLLCTMVGAFAPTSPAEAQEPLPFTIQRPVGPAPTATPCTLTYQGSEEVVLGDGRVAVVGNLVLSVLGHSDETVSIGVVGGGPKASFQITIASQQCDVIVPGGGGSGSVSPPFLIQLVP